MSTPMLGSGRTPTHTDRSTPPYRVVYHPVGRPLPDGTYNHQALRKFPNGITESFGHDRMALSMWSYVEWLEEEKGRLESELAMALEGNAEPVMKR